MWGGAELPPQEAAQHQLADRGTLEPGLRPGEGMTHSSRLDRRGYPVPPERALVYAEGSSP